MTGKLYRAFPAKETGLAETWPAALPAMRVCG
jgi:hypothetical protein